MPKSANSTQTKSTGKEVLAYCTSCKMDLAHLIASMTGDRISKVECKTCKKTHVFKAPKGITEPNQAPPKKSKKTKAADSANEPKQSIEAEWQKLMAAQKNVPAKSYQTKTKFQLGDRINHPVFGEGIVGRLIYPNKVEVVFRTDLKILIHGGHP